MDSLGGFLNFIVNDQADMAHLLWNVVLFVLMIWTRPENARFEIWGPPMSRGTLE